MVINLVSDRLKADKLTVIIIDSETRPVQQPAQ